MVVAMFGSAVAALGTLQGVDAPATAVAPAVRGTQVVVDPPPERVGCRRVAVLGDSLMDNARWYLLQELSAAGFDGIVEAHHSRRIPATVRAPYSGVTAARQLRAGWGEADCWLVALGSNDLVYGGGEPASAAALVEAQVAAVTPGARVWWVNLNYRRDPTFPFDFPRATSVFNAELDRRARLDPSFQVIDWYSLSSANAGWFFDPVHVDIAGSRARAAQAIDALPR